MKKDALKSIQSIFFSNSFLEFEDKVTRHFYRRYKNSVVLHNYCTDWLLDKLRKLQKRQNGDNYLLTGYLSNIELRSFAERERFFHFIQFLSFIKNCKHSKLKGREVYQIVFPASFRTYQNKYDLQVKIQILKTFASVEVEKRIYIRDIYGFNVLSNVDKTRIKKIFIKLFNELKINKCRQSTFKLISSSEKMKETNQLTPLLLSQNKIILFQENTNYHI